MSSGRWSRRPTLGIEWRAHLRRRRFFLDDHGSPGCLGAGDALAERVVDVAWADDAANGQAGRGLVRRGHADVTHAEQTVEHGLSEPQVTDSKELQVVDGA